MACEKRFFPNYKDMTTAPLSSPQAYAEGLSAAGILSIPAADIAAYLLIAALIAAAVVLTNRQIRSSRDLMKKSDQLVESERELFERRLAERTRALVEAEEGRLSELERNARFGELSRGLFHDLLNPLSALTIYAERMNERSDLSDTARDMVAKMISTSRRLDSYMESVRRSIGSVKTDAMTSDLRHEIDIVRDILGYKARMNKVGIIIDQKDKIELTVHPVRLHQLMLNLVSNAIEACEEYEKSRGDAPARDHVVTISARKDAASIRISVSDNGMGISKENLGRLFKESFTTKEKGTGLGLTTVKTIVEKDLKGTIAVESEEGKGAEFVIMAPHLKL